MRDDTYMRCDRLVREAWLQQFSNKRNGCKDTTLFRPIRDFNGAEVCEEYFRDDEQWGATKRPWSQEREDKREIE